MNVSKNLQNQFVKKYSKNYLKLTENVRNEDNWDSVEKKKKALLYELFYDTLFKLTNQKTSSGIDSRTDYQLPPKQPCPLCQNPNFLSGEFAQILTKFRTHQYFSQKGLSNRYRNHGQENQNHSLKPLAAFPSPFLDTVDY
jgi:hypothetical protein